MAAPPRRTFEDGPDSRQEVRNRKVRQLRSLGYSLREIGRAHNLSHEQVRQICGEAPPTERAPQVAGG